MSERLLAIVASFFLAGLTGVTGWAWATSQRVTIVEEHVEGHTAQLSDFMQGRALPMSDEARIRLDALSHQIAEVQRQIAIIDAGQHKIIDRLLDDTHKRR